MSKRGTGRKSQSTNNTANCPSNWQIVTGSWHILPNRGPCLDWGLCRRQHILESIPEVCWNFCFLYISVSCNGPKTHQWLWKNANFPIWLNFYGYILTNICMCHLPIWRSPLTSWKNRDWLWQHNILDHIWLGKNWGWYNFYTKHLGLFYLAQQMAQIVRDILPYFGKYKEASFWLEWKCITHWLVPTNRARQYSSRIHSKPLNTAFSLSFQTRGALRPLSLQFTLFPLF